jgi:hypothetical protein
MTNISSNFSGNKLAAVNGRGIPLRHLDNHQRADLAADWVLGAFDVGRPTQAQAASIFGAAVSAVAKHVRAKTGGNGNGGHARKKNNGAAAVVSDTTVMVAEQHPSILELRRLSDLIDDVSRAQDNLFAAYLALVDHDLIGHANDVFEVDHQTGPRRETGPLFFRFAPRETSCAGPYVSLSQN